MHTVWKGAISFGLVHVPVKMFSATEDKDIAMKMIHKACGGPISYVRQCKNCDVDVEWGDIAKGYEYEKGRYVLFDKDELDALASEASKTIQILDFVDLQDIDPIYFQKTYYLSPDQAGGNAYHLLMEAMRSTGKIGISKISIRSKSSLAAIRVLDNCLAIETVFYPDEIRPVSQVPGLPESTNINEKELTMAKLLIEQLSTPFEPGKYIDDYRNRLMDAISKKIAGEEVHIAPEQQRTHVVDLMAALQASLSAIPSDPKNPATQAEEPPTGKKVTVRKRGAGARANADEQRSASSAKQPPAKRSRKETVR